MKHTQYEYSSTHIVLPPDLAKKVIGWGKENIPDDMLFVDPENPTFGREDDPHVTVLYGIHSDSPTECAKALRPAANAYVALGRMDMFTNDSFDVLFISIFSPDLKKLNSRLINSVEYTNKYDEYHPHCTIAYLKKGEAKQFKNDKQFVGEHFFTKEIVFSSKNGKKSMISLH